MIRGARQLTARSLVLGLLLTIAVLILDSAGQLAPVEAWFYDERARHFQHFSPAPTDRLVHLDIDDAALETIGSWPWPRSTFADIVDEVRLAGADALALDILLTEPQELGVRERADGTIEKIDHDANLAAAFKRFGKVMIPVHFDFTPRAAPSPRLVALGRELRQDLELTVEEASSRVAAAMPGESISDDEFLAARREALLERIMEAPAGESMQTLKARLLPRSKGVPNASLSREFDMQFRRAESLVAIRRFTLPAPALPEGAAPLLTATDESVMIPPFARVASHSGYVNYLKRADDAVIRSVPLAILHRGRVYPQMDLALACAVLDVDIQQVRLEPRRVVIPRAGKSDIIIPVHDVPSDAHGAVGLFADIPWNGGRDWRTNFDYPNYRQIKQHVPITLLWALADFRKTTAHNDQELAKACGFFAEAGLDSAKAFLKSPAGTQDIPGRIAQMEAIVREATELAGPVLQTPPADRTPDDKVFIDALEAVQHVLADTRTLARKSAEVRSALAGKAVLVGWTATGMTDVVPTPLEESVPGVVVHGMVFSAIVNDHFWRTSPAWVTGLITAIAGLLTTAIVALSSPYRAVVLTVLLSVGYVMVNSLVVFDYGNWLVGMAGPIASIVVVWATLTLVRVVAEAKERARITRRFQSYVDPGLVKYVIEHPELARLEGEVREMTVAFTDLAGFTTFTETLREKAVKILGRYISRMVPAIRENRGLVHRFMGDGIMFSYGAPIRNPDHACDAVATVLRMQRTLFEFNQELESEGFPTLTMRAGICTGPAVVGDSGADDAAEYACLGDTTNTAARLEGANKSMGTACLISARTVELLRGKFLVRPVGRLRLVGKREAVMAYEPIAAAESATDPQRDLAAMTTAIFDRFRVRDFAGCIEAAERLDAAHGKSKLADLYRQTCRRYQEECPADFEGEIELAEK